MNFKRISWPLRRRRPRMSPHQHSAAPTSFDAQTGRVERRETAIPLPVLLNLGFALVLAAGTYVLSTYLFQEKMESIGKRELTKVSLETAALARRLTEYSHDLVFLRRQQALSAAVADPGNVQALETLCADFIQSMDHIDKIRWLDETGTERVRVELRDSLPIAVKPPQLQHKGGRYYFAETLRLNDGEIYVSPLDLNVENGLLELPHRPVVRMATVVTDAEGAKRGILIINFTSEEILQPLTTDNQASDVQTGLVNSDGFWLNHPESMLEWGFMLDRPDWTLAVSNPKQWKAILATERGNRLDETGYWVWSTVYPTRAVNRTKPFSNTPATDERRPGFYKLLRHMPPEQISAARHQAWLPIGLTSFALLTLFVTASHILASNRRRRRAVAERLRASNLLSAIADASDDAIFATDMNGRLVFFNRSCEKATGKTAAEVLGLDEHKLFPPEQASEQFADNQQVMREGKGLRKLETLTTAAGERTFLTSKQPMRNAEGEIFGMCGVARDVSELQQREQALRDSREHIQRLLDSIAEGVYGVDLQGNCTFINAAARRMLGYPDESELLGRNMHAITHYRRADGSPYPSAECRIYEVAKSGSGVQVDDEVFWRKDGAPIPVEYRAHCLFRNGERTGTVVTWLEISERKATQEYMNKLSLAIEQSPDSVLITDTHAVIDYVNPTFERHTGYRSQEVIGRSVGLLRAEQTPKRMLRELWRTARRGAPWKGEIAIRRKDGSRYTSYAHVAPLRRTDGRVSHYVSVQEDITEKKRLGEELNRHRHHLEELVAQRTAQLEEARQKAEIANQAKSVFLANMSHEIRTPLNAVLGLARIGARTNAGNETETTFRRIQAAGEHLLQVINDILDFSKLEANKLNVENHGFSLAGMLADTVNLINVAAHEKGLSYVLEAAPDLPDWVLGDSHRLKQILVNLLSNAVKFTEQGEVRLQVRAHGERITFQVADTGIGMDPAQMARLFQPFEQADSSTTRRFGGTGLGLAISRRLANIMDGEISVRSSAGAGSVFTLKLPLPATDAHEAEPWDQAVGDIERLAGMQVLAVEDLADNRLILEDLLQIEGAGVVFAENGLQALERIREHGAEAFDLVLMDVQMPIMDGYEATRRIRKIAPQLPVIGLTAHAMAEEKKRCAAAGMVAHVTKPIDPERLLATMRAYTAGSSREPLRVPAPGAQSSPPTSAEESGGRTGADAEPTQRLIAAEALLTRYGGRRNFIEKLAKTAISAHADDARSLRAAAGSAAPDLQQIVHVAHGLKGLGGNMEAARVHQFARDTEMAAREEKPSAAASALELADLAERFLGELSAWGAASRRGRSGSETVHLYIAQDFELFQDIQGYIEVVGFLCKHRVLVVTSLHHLAKVVR